MDEKFIDYLLEQSEEKLNKHDIRINLIENKQSETNIRLEYLCNNIESLTNSIKWLISIVITTLLSFFIWVIQNNIF